MRPLDSDVRALVMVLCSVAILTPPRMVRAQGEEEPAQNETDRLKSAEAHFKQGRAYFEAGEMDRAIDEYEKANQLVPHPVNDFNIALALRAKGDKRAALARFKRYLQIDPKGSRSDEASSYIAELTPIIEAEDAELARQEAERKRLEAERAEAERKRQEAEAAREVERLRQAREAARAESRPLRWAGIGTAAAGLVTMGIGAYYGFDAMAKESDINDASMWSASLDATWSAGESAETKMIWLTSVGGAVTVAGGVLWYLGHRQLAAAERRVTVLPTASDGSAGLVVVGGF